MEDTTVPDPTQEPGAPTTPFAPFGHLVAPNWERYRRILAAFATARGNFVVHLRPADIAADLGVPADEALVADLDRLAAWGNLRTIPDTGRVTSVEDFRRRRQLYALTKAGEATEAALAGYAAAMAQRAQLQTVALADLRANLHVLLALTDADDPDAGRVAATLRDIETVFSGLADNAAAFMGSLTRSIDTAADGVEGFLTYKDRLIGYLQRFIGDLVVSSSEIASLLARLDERGVDALLVLAARRAAADAAPGPADDPAHADGSGAAGHASASPVDRPGEPTPDEDDAAAWRARWQGLRRWFVGEPGRPAQAELLRARARAAIPDLLEAVTAIQARQAGRSDDTADWTTLARWFAEAPTDDDAHRLWRAAFGLASARHLTVDGETLDRRRDHPVPGSTPWTGAPAVHVSARLRRTTRYQRRGPVRATDRSASRRLLVDRLTAERAELDAARARLATGRPLRLSELAVDAATFPVLLELLGEALAASTGTVAETISMDGRLSIRLSRTGDGAVAEVRTPTGILRGHDHVITVTDLLAGVDPEPSRPVDPHHSPEVVSGG